ncbi:MAG: amidohydrolase family protein [Pseudomonadota bacterium]
MITAIKADRVLDGSGNDPLEPGCVVVDGGRIKSVHAGPVPEGLAADATIDLPGCTLMPGLIDTHVHLNLPGTGVGFEESVEEGAGVLLASSVSAAGKALAAGITTVRDVGAYRRTSFDVRRAIELGYVVGSRVLACGQPITITGGHTWPFGGEADGVENLRRKVRQLIKDGAEFIKVMGSGGGTIGTAAWRPAFTPDELNAIADEAHRNERKITVHCLCAASIDDAVNAKVDQIEHAGFLINQDGDQVYDPAVGDRLAASGIPVTGTLAVGATVLNALRAKNERTPAEDLLLSRWERMVQDNLNNYARLRDAGVAFVAGTDAGWRYTTFDSLVLEMEMMVCGGSTTMETIVAATGFAADVIGLSDEAGRLREGLDADIIAVRGNPLERLDALRDVEMIMHRGVERQPAGRSAITPQAAECPAL